MISKYSLLLHNIKVYVRSYNAAIIPFTNNGHEKLSYSASKMELNRIGFLDLNLPLIRSPLNFKKSSGTKRNWLLDNSKPHCYTRTK